MKSTVTTALICKDLGGVLLAVMVYKAIRGQHQDERNQSEAANNGDCIQTDSFGKFASLKQRSKSSSG